MGDPIYTSHRGLIDLANRECGYRNVWVDHGDQARWSNRGNLVVEHTYRGTEDVCRDGRVLSRNQPLNRGDYYTPPRRDYYPPQHHHYHHSSSDDAALIIGAGLLGAAVGIALTD